MPNIRVLISVAANGAWEATPCYGWEPHEVIEQAREVWCHKTRRMHPAVGHYVLRAAIPQPRIAEVVAEVEEIDD